MAPQSYEEWVSTRFQKERVYSDQIANIIRDGPLKLPERKAWQIYMSPQMQNFREMKRMEAAAEGQANQRLVVEEVQEQKRNSEPGPAVDLGFVANGVNRMNSTADVLQQQIAGLESAHRLHTEGIAAHLSKETDRLAQELLANRERDRTTLELQSKFHDAMHADMLRLTEAVGQAGQTVNIQNTTVNQSTTNEHMVLLQQNLLQQQARFDAAAAELIAQNRAEFAQMSKQMGLTAQEMKDLTVEMIKKQQPVVNVDARSVVIDARSQTNVVVNAPNVLNQLNQMVESKSVTNVLNYQGGPGGGQPPPSAGAAMSFGPVRRTKDKDPVFPFPYSKAIEPPSKAAIADQLAISEKPPSPPQPAIVEPSPIPPPGGPRLPIEDAPKPPLPVKAMVVQYTTIES